MMESITQDPEAMRMWMVLECQCDLVNLTQGLNFA